MLVIKGLGTMCAGIISWWVDSMPDKIFLFLWQPDFNKNSATFHHILVLIK